MPLAFEASAANRDETMERIPAPRGTGRLRWVILALVWLIALNLRSGLIAVSPVLPLIRTALHLDHAAAQVLFSVPIVPMSLLAIPGGILADRYGARRLVAAGLILLALGELARVWAGGYAALLATTLLWAVGLGGMQPALPKLVQGWFPERSQVVTGVYTSGFVSGAALAGWLTTPYLLTTTGSWRGTFAAWGALAGATCILWLFLGREAPGTRRLALRARVWGRLRDVAGSAVKARQLACVAALLASQSLLFYSLSAWLPTYLHESGWPLDRASGPYTLFECIAIPAAVFGPWLMQRLGRRRPTMVVAGVAFTLAVVGLIVLPNQGTWVWVAVAGATNPLAFVMGLALPVEIAPPERAASATGMALAVSYAVALLGPPLAGLLRDATGQPAAGLIPALVAGIALTATSAVVPERTRTVAT